MNLKQRMDSAAMFYSDLWLSYLEKYLQNDEK